MLKSMTGFGIAEYNDDRGSMRVEIRSENNKFLKINTRLPEQFQSFESEFDRAIRKKIVRGSVVLSLNYKSFRQENDFTLNTEKIEEYYRLISELKGKIKCAEEISINSLVQLPGVLQKNKDDANDAESLLSICHTLIDEALEKLSEMRITEGTHIKKDILQRKDFIVSMMDKFEERLPLIIQEYAKRLRSRVAFLLSETNVELTDSNLCREVAIFAERSDIAEEINRLKSHIHQLQETLDSNESIGRKLDFIIQEMFRETNTMCSKANDTVLLKDLIDIKMEIEKIREQAFNIE
ncbi:MAG: YicC family protein [Planctomycetes bacterium RBG_16_41_13]|nr:MAG: YicC family protein [Planctomycetes bacterium RBG_16_41_13]